MIQRTIWAIIILSILFWNCKNRSAPSDTHSTKVLSTTEIESSFSKYSYKLTGVWKGAPTSATGFFIRKKGRIFFITAFHFIASQDLMRKIPYPSQIDSVAISIKDLQGKEVGPIFSVKEIRTSNESHFFDEGPDIYIIDMTENFKGMEAYIHSVDQFQLPFSSNPPNEIFSIGYAKTSLDSADTWKKKNFQYWRIQEKESFEYVPAGRTIELTNGYFVDGLSEPGMSGAPVFFKYVDGGKTSFVFAGSISGRFTQKNKTLIIKPVEMVVRIDQKLKGKGL